MASRLRRLHRRRRYQLAIAAGRVALHINRRARWCSERAAVKAAAMGQPPHRVDTAPAPPRRQLALTHRSNHPRHSRAACPAVVRLCRAAPRMSRRQSWRSQPSLAPPQHAPPRPRTTLVPQSPPAHRLPASPWHCRRCSHDEPAAPPRSPPEMQADPLTNRVADGQVRIGRAAHHHLRVHALPSRRSLRSLLAQQVSTRLLELMRPPFLIPLVRPAWIRGVRAACHRPMGNVNRTSVRTTSPSYSMR